MNDDEPQGRELNRRELLGTVGAAGALALGGSALAQPAGSAAPISPASQSAAAAPKPFELEELSVRDLSAGMAAGRWTPAGWWSSTSGGSPKSTGPGWRESVRMRSRRPTRR